MQNRPTEKLSRRDALKVLIAATGAAALANVPDRWIKPDMNVGVLPAHAQTSTGPHTIAAGPSDSDADFCQLLTSTATITPPDSGIFLRYTITSNVFYDPPSSPTGTIATDNTGSVSLSIGATPGPALPQNVSVLWEFANPADGTGSSTQSFTGNNSGC